MSKTTDMRSMTRRDLLASGVATGTAFVVGTGFLTHATEAWALETKALQPATMATLVQMARDIYPHDHVADQYYAVAVKGYDEAAAKDEGQKAFIEGGVAMLDGLAAGRGHGSYLGMGWERDRVDLLRSIESSPFFQTIRGGLVTGLYNNKDVWPLFGYEGESFSQGGYIDRGFNDIDWL